MYDIIIISDCEKVSKQLNEALIYYQIHENIDIDIYHHTFCDEFSFLQSAAIYIVDATSAQSQHKIKQIREANVDNMIILLLESISDLIKVLTPLTMPSGVLQKEIEYSEIKLLLNQIVATIEQQNSSAKRYIWTSKAHTYSIPIDKILYFESRNKATYLVSSTQEYELHVPLDNLESELQSEFLRLHRSYLVNVKKISEYDFGKMTAIMDDGSMVLISRSGKEKLKGMMQDSRI